MPYSRFPFFYPQNFYNKYSRVSRPYSNNNWYNKKNLSDTNSSTSNEYKNLYNTNESFNNKKNSYNIAYSSPSGYNSSFNQNFQKNVNVIENNLTPQDLDKKNNSKRSNDNDSYFFELFGLKLYFDDILLICLIFFLYEEGVRDDELFISLILLLLS